MKIIRWGNDQYAKYWVEVREDGHISAGTGLDTQTHVVAWLRERGLTLENAVWLGQHY